MLEEIKNVALFAGYIATILTCITLFIKPIRTWLLTSIHTTLKNKEDQNTLAELKVLVEKQVSLNNLQGDALKCILRNNLTHLYYQYIKETSLSAYERENIINLYESYENLGGNSYITSCYDELLKKSVKISE